MTISPFLLTTIYFVSALSPTYWNIIHN